MKKHFITGLALLGVLSTATAAIYYQGTGVSGDSTPPGPSFTPLTIYDGNPAYVVSASMNLSTYAAGNNWSLTSLTITLNITGGMNNGLYGYLIAPDGSTLTLMNQPGYLSDPNGFGATGSGMNITLTDAYTSQGSIQNTTSGSALSGLYNPKDSLSGLAGLNPNGTWTLYFADTLAGGGNATLAGWSLNIEAVPEPVNVALGAFGLLAVGGLAWKRWHRRSAADQSD